MTPDTNFFYQRIITSLKCLAEILEPFVTSSIIRQKSKQHGMEMALSGDGGKGALRFRL